MAVLITREHLRVYRNYGGDIDGFARMATAAERTLVSDAEWDAIGILLISVSQLKRGQLSPGNAERIMRSLWEQCADEAVVLALMDMA